MAWISARHPRTFRGSLRRSSSFFTRECLADFRLPREFWSWRMESAHRFVFCLIAMLRHSSKSDANGASHDITSSLQDSYAYRLRFFDRGIDYYLPVFGNPSSHFWVPIASQSSAHILPLISVFRILRRRIGESHRKTSTTSAYHERRAKRLGH
jgi:hypothetical protein